MSLAISLIILENIDFYQNSSKFIFMVSLILLRIETICHGDGLISVNEDNEIYSLII